MNKENKCIVFVEMSLSNGGLHIIVGTRNRGIDHLYFANRKRGGEAVRE